MNRTWFVTIKGYALLKSKFIYLANTGRPNGWKTLLTWLQQCFSSRKCFTFRNIDGRAYSFEFRPKSEFYFWRNDCNVRMQLTPVLIRIKFRLMAAVWRKSETNAIWCSLIRFACVTNAFFLFQKSFSNATISGHLLSGASNGICFVIICLPVWLNTGVVVPTAHEIVFFLFAFSLCIRVSTVFFFFFFFPFVFVGARKKNVHISL